MWRVSLLAACLWPRTHSLLQPLLCVYPMLWPQRAPSYSQILKGSVPCSLLLCMQCPPRPTQWGSAQTFPLPWNYRHSSCTFPFPQYPHRKYQMKKKLLNIYYLNKLVLRTQNWNKSSPSLMELRVHLGRSKSKSVTTWQWVNCLTEDLPEGGWRNCISKDKEGHRCWSYI